jgi:hypothetical protein
VLGDEIADLASKAEKFDDLLHFVLDDLIISDEGFFPKGIVVRR